MFDTRGRIAKGAIHSNIMSTIPALGEGPRLKHIHLTATVSVRQSQTQSIGMRPQVPSNGVFYRFIKVGTTKRQLGSVF